jgi:hypothetical protein
MVQLGADPSQPADFLNSLQPVRILIALASITALIGWAVRLRGRQWRVALGIGWMVAASPLLFVLPSLVAPAHGFQAEEDVGLLTVLRQLPDGGGLLIASDLADEAEDYRRPLRAFSLTAYTGRPFYVANLQYGKNAEPDATRRMIGLREFFGAPWSAWDTRWLVRTGITGVLVDERCEPAWFTEAHAALREVVHSGRWTGFVVTAGTVDAFARDTLPPQWRDMTPAYGRSECLTGLRPDTSAASGHAARDSQHAAHAAADGSLAQVVRRDRRMGLHGT